MPYNTSLDNVYVGLEDVRPFSSTSYSNEIIYNANRGLSANDIGIEHGKINLITGENMGATILREQAIEKNWVLLEDAKGHICHVYGWYPLKIGIVIENERPQEKEEQQKPQQQQQKQPQKQSNLIVTHEHMTPYFFKHIRGSSNGICIETKQPPHPPQQLQQLPTKEIWFLCHCVSYEDRRYYYHIWIVLDQETLTLKKYSPFFTFEKGIVEYAMGLMYWKETNELIVGYSLYDRETKYTSISVEDVEKTLILYK